MVSSRGIEANPEKVQAIARIQEPTNIKGVKQLTGRLAALSHFISRLGERTLLFYQLLRKGEKFEWTEEARQAFADLKKTLSPHQSWRYPRNERSYTSTWQRVTS